MSHALATASCESVNPSQQRHFYAEGSIVADGWITSPVQTFGLTVEPLSKEDSQVRMELLNRPYA